MSEPLEYHLNLRGMSGRVVRFHLLTTEQIEAIEDNAARQVGEDATPEQLRRAQLKLLVAGMIHSFSAPGVAPKRVPDPADPKKVLTEGGYADEEAVKAAKFELAEDAASLQLRWTKLFNAKESSALTVLYRDHHELNGAEIQMLVGKAHPVSPKD